MLIGNAVLNAVILGCLEGILVSCSFSDMTVSFCHLDHTSTHDPIQKKYPNFAV